MNLGQTIRHGVKWAFLGNTGGHVLQFLFGIALARLLLPADFGAVATVQVFTGFVGLLAAGGLGQSLIRAAEATPEDFNAVFTAQLLVGMLIYAGFYVAAPLVADYFGNPLYADLMRVTAVSFVIRPFASIRFAWLSRAMEFKKRSLIQLAVGTLGGASSVVMALFGMGVWSLVFSGLIAAVATNILLSYIVPLHLKLKWHAKALAVHSSYGAKITFNELLNYVKEQAVYLIVSKSEGPASLGLLTRAESVARLPNRFVTPPVGQVVFRAMSKVQADIDQSKYLFFRTITLLTVYVTPLLVAFLWVIEPFVLVVYGKNWLAAAEPARVLVVAGFFLTIGRASSVLLEAQNRLNQEMVVQAVALMVGVSGCFIGLRWGLTGVAWALVAAHLVSVVALYVLAHRAVGARVVDLFRAVRPALLLNGLLAVALAMLHMAIASLKGEAPALYLIAMTAAGALVYVSAFMLMPLTAIQAEAQRWRNAVRSALKLRAR